MALCLFKREPWCYRSIIWGGRWGSNPRPPESQSGALPTELRPPLLLRAYFTLFPTIMATHHTGGIAGYPAVARPAGLEPATLGLEGRCSIRLSYGRTVLPYPSAFGPAKPAFLKLVGVEGFEPPTHCSQSSCATRLRYTPTLFTAGQCYGVRRGTSTLSSEIFVYKTVQFRPCRTLSSKQLPDPFPKHLTVGENRRSEIYFAKVLSF